MNKALRGKLLRVLQDKEFIGSARLKAPEPSQTAIDEPVTSYADALANFEKTFLADALRASGGRVSETAKRIGIGRATLYKKIVALGIEM